MSARVAGRGESPLNTFSVEVTGGASSSGVFAAIPNPTGKTIVIQRADFRITTASSGASTVDIGVAANATTSNDTLIDGLSGASTGLFSSVDDTDNGTNGVAKGVVCTASQFVTVAEASGNVDGLVGRLHLTYYIA